MIIWDKNCYTEQEYRDIKKQNRKAFLLDPEGYCEKQKEFNPKYVLVTDKDTYYMDNWVKGTGYIKKELDDNVGRYWSAMEVFNLKHALPKNYVSLKFSVDVGDNILVRYISHTCMFECMIRETTLNYKIYYGDKKEIEEVVL